MDKLIFIKTFSPLKYISIQKHIILHFFLFTVKEMAFKYYYYILVTFVSCDFFSLKGASSEKFKTSNKCRHNYMSYIMLYSYKHILIKLKKINFSIIYLSEQITRHAVLISFFLNFLNWFNSWYLDKIFLNLCYKYMSRISKVYVEWYSYPGIFKRR